MKVTQQEWIAYEEVRRNPVARMAGQARFGRLLGLEREKLEWIRDHYRQLRAEFKKEITQQDWIAYEEVRTNPLTELTGQVLFARILGLPKDKLEWIRDHYCELEREFNTEK
jgi:hypothetical protein